MTGSVLDILIYVFDQYMLAELPEVPAREALAADLERAGFGRHNVERALDWLADLRSEEHTSELQSRQYLVCRLLLEKKKNIRRYHILQKNIKNYHEISINKYLR